NRLASWIAWLNPAPPFHPHQAEVSLRDPGHAADPEQRHRHRNLRTLGERLKLAHRAGDHHAVTGEDDRPLRRVQDCGSLRERRLWCLRRGTPTGHGWRSAVPVEVTR